MNDTAPGEYDFTVCPLPAEYVRSLFRRRSLDPEHLRAELPEGLFISVVTFHHVDFSTNTSKLGAYVSRSRDDIHDLIRSEDTDLMAARSLLKEICNWAEFNEGETIGKVRLLIQQ